MSVLQCNDVTMSYEGINVFEHLSFSLNKGDYLCVLGENGSGKSTLMKGILGLLKPTCGTIEYSDGLTQKEIGYLPQQSQIQRDFPASVYEVVLSGTLNTRGLKPFYSRHEKELAHKNLERLSITHLKNRCYRELSGGQQQRVLLARALLGVAMGWRGARSSDSTDIGWGACSKALRVCTSAGRLPASPFCVGAPIGKGDSGAAFSWNWGERAWRVFRRSPACRLSFISSCGWVFLV